MAVDEVSSTAMKHHPGRPSTLLVVCALLLIAAGAQAQTRYTISQEGDIVRMQDTREQIAVSILTTGSNAYEMKVKGQDVIRKTFATVEDFRARPGLNGIPYMAPFANRLDEQAFYANGKKYNFDMELGNVRGKIPIHGYLSGARDWTLVEAKADDKSAWVTSRLDFYRNPQYMKQFPFAHVVTMTYRLSEGMLEVHTRLENLSNEPMPVSIGFHPYFQLTDSTREDWTLAVGARTHWLLGPTTIPTGETQPIATLLPDPARVPLKDVSLDDVFSDLERDAQGRATVSMTGKQQQLDVLVGPKFKTLVIYSPRPGSGRGPAAGSPATPSPNPNFVAIEPMVGITNAMNLAHKGVYKELQSVEPGGVWEESFWIRPKGF
jgi:aldose 1-epimerase